jgi:hypothetical protein
MPAPKALCPSAVSVLPSHGCTKNAVSIRCQCTAVIWLHQKHCVHPLSVYCRHMASPKALCPSAAIGGRTCLHHQKLFKKGLTNVHFTQLTKTIILWKWPTISYLDLSITCALDVQH